MTSEVEGRLSDRLKVTLCHNDGISLLKQVSKNEMGLDAKRQFKPSQVTLPRAFR